MKAQKVRENTQHTSTREKRNEKRTGHRLHEVLRILHFGLELNEDDLARKGKDHVGQGYANRDNLRVFREHRRRGPRRP